MADATNVKIVISAVTEAAQQAIDEVGDELTGIADDAEVGQTTLDQFSDELSETTSRAALAQGAIDEVGDEALSTAVKTKALQSAQDELGDEFDETTAKALANAGALQANSASATSASSSFGLLNSTILLSLIPTILTLGTVLAPLAVTLGAIAAGAVALAGAFGLIIGSGILAFGQERAQQNKERLQQVNSQIAALERLQDSEAGLTRVQQRRLKRLKEEKQQLDEQTSITGALGAAVGELKDELLPLITTFGEQFIPLIEDALDAIPTLVRDMLDAVGGTDEFREALRRFGAIMMDVLPALVGLMFDLARVALPVLEDLVSFLQDNGEGALQAMGESLDQTQDEFSELLDAIIEFLPVLLEFGTEAAEVIVPALTGLIRAATQFMEVVLALPEPIQNLVIAGLTLAPLLVKFGGLLSALVPSAYSLGVVFGIVEAAVKGFIGIVSGSLTVAAALGAAIGLVAVKLLDMVGFFDHVQNAGAAFADAVGDWVDPILTFMSIISLGIIPLLGALGGIILGLVRGDLAGGVENAKQILGIFADAFRNTYDMIVGFLAGLGEMFVTFFLQTLPSVVMGFAATLLDVFVTFFTQTLPRLVAQGMGFLVALIETPLNRIYNLFVGVWNGIIELLEMAIENVINGVVNMVNSFLEGIQGVADAVSDVIGRDIGDVGTLDRVDIDTSGFQAQRRETDFGEIRQRRTQQAQTVVQGGVNVNVEGDDFGRNPRRDSRTFADQLRREVRNDSGAN